MTDINVPMGGIKAAKWVGAPTEAVPIIRKSLSIKNPKNSYIDVCGLGFFELYVNGKKVSDEILVPSQSDYTERDMSTLSYPLSDKFSYRVYYRHYLLDEYLVKGENIFDFWLGDGWYRQTIRVAEGKLSYGDPRLVFCIYADGEEHLSDESLTWRESYIVKQNIFFGETHDFRHLDEEWKNVRLMDAPMGELCPDFPLSDKVIRRIIPTLLYDDGERKIYDAGENLAGVLSFTMPKVPSGSETVVYHSELLESPSALSPHGCGRDQIDRYISDGDEHFCAPKFLFHGFRYLEVVGAIEDPCVLVIHSDIPEVSEFSSSDEVINWLYTATVRSLYSNMHGGVISDCPHREKLGYTGDGQLSADAAMTLLGSETLFEKWLIDIADGQNPDNGHIQHTAPFGGGGGGPGGWGCAIVTVPYMLYQHYHRVDLLAKYYPNMLDWLDYMYSRSEDGIVVREEEKGWCLGEWCVAGGNGNLQIPDPFVNTYFLIKSLWRVAEISDVLGFDGTPYREKANEISAHLTKKYYSPEENTFCDGVQGADAFAIDIGLGNEAMLDALAKKYDALGEFDTGIFGTDIVVRVLFENGYANTAIKLLSSDKENSFGGMMKNGETTLAEYWNCLWASHNHHMFGAVTKYLFYYLLGIQDDGERLVVSPSDYSADLLPAVSGSLVTRFGKVSVKRWFDDRGKAHFEILSECDALFRFRDEEREIPCNSVVEI